MNDSEDSPSDWREWREQRRLQAWELHLQGWSQPKIAEALEVTQGAVSQWIRRAEQGGVNALLHRRAPGRRAALTEAQFAELPTLIERGAKAYGFRGDYWTTQRVADAVNQVFGVSYHPAHVSRLLRKHCPTWRAEKGAESETDGKDENDKASTRQ